MSDLYAALGLERTASQQDIRKAYQRQALVHHPDKGGNEETFKKVSTAYEVLKDEGKRQQYDMTGQIPGEAPGMPPGFPGVFSGGFPGGMPGMPGGMPFAFDIGNLFGMFNRGNSNNRNPKSPKAPSKRETLQLTLDQLYFGHSFTMYLDRSRMCLPCTGTGASKRESCTGCGGRGMTVQTMNLGGMVVQTQGPCSTCDSTGFRTTELCSTCQGTKKQNEKKAIDVKVVAGAQDGDILTFTEVCSESPEYEKAGDLLLQIETKPTAWKRKGSHLEIDVTINLAESLLGCRVSLEGHPSLEQTLVQIPPGSFTGDTYCSTGQGMPVQNTVNQYGDLYINIKMAISHRERAELASATVQERLIGVFGEGRRPVEEVKEDGEVLKDLRLTK